MNGLYEGRLLSADGLVSEVSVYMEHSPASVTIVPKPSEPFLLFSAEEQLRLEVNEKGFLRTYRVLFKELKIMPKKTYYVFTVLPPETPDVPPSPSAMKLPALYTTNSGSGVATILSVADGYIELVVADTFSEPRIQLSYRTGGESALFDGNVIWHEPKQTRHYYGLSSN